MNYNKNVLLINAPLEQLGFGAKWKKTDVLTPPLGLMYLAHPLIKEGYNVSFVDFNIERFEKWEFLNIIKDKNFLLFYCYTFSLKNVAKIIEIVKVINKRSFIMCGGPYCNFSQKYVEGSDLTVVGEAEDFIVDILNRVAAKKSLSDIPGLIYKQNGVLSRNPGLLQVKDINCSNHSAWELSREKEYGFFFGHKVKKITGMVCSRGCPYRCNFCTNKGIIRHRKRSVENVIVELKDLHDKGFKFIVFFDEHFLQNKKWVNEILNHIISEKIRLKFIIQCRVDSADYDLFKKMRKAGVIAIMFGIENANQKVLDFYDKGINVDMINKALRMSNKLGFLTGGYFMLGSPLEEEAHFEVNRKFIRKAPLDYLNVNILRYYAGTKLWAEALKEGIIEENETIVYANEKLSNNSYQEWLYLKDRLLREHYSRPTRIVSLIFKCIRFGLFSLAIGTIWNSKRSFFIMAANPFMPVDQEASIKA